MRFFGEAEIITGHEKLSKIGKHVSHRRIARIMKQGEIIGYSSGPNKDATLVKKAFRPVNTNLSQIKIFHTDRGSGSPALRSNFLPLVGNEFKNQVIHEILDAFNIERSLSMKGEPSHDLFPPLVRNVSL